MGQGKWKALKGGLTWYLGSITHVNRDETVDVMYDDGDVEHRVPLRFIQLLDKQPKGSGSGRGLKRKGCSSGRAADGSTLSKRRFPAAFAGAHGEGGADVDDSFADGDGSRNAWATDGDGRSVGSGASSRKGGNGSKRKAKSKAKAVPAAGGKGGGLRQSKTRLIVQELPDAEHGRPLEECLRILNAVLDSKVAAPLLAADRKALFPLLVRAADASEGTVVRLPVQAVPLDFSTIKAKLVESCQGPEVSSSPADSCRAQGSDADAVRYYSSAQQVREDVVRLVRFVNDSWPVRQALRVSCAKVFEAFNDLFEARISPLHHQIAAAEIKAFQHGPCYLSEGDRGRVKAREG